MATERLEMRKTREILELRWAQGRSVRETAESLRISTGVVSKMVTRAKKAGLTWPKVPEMNDAALERLLYGEPTAQGTSRPEPGQVWMHRELKRPGVTLELLHLEYLLDCGDEPAPGEQMARVDRRSDPCRRDPGSTHPQRAQDHDEGALAPKGEGKEMTLLGPGRRWMIDGRPLAEVDQKKEVWTRTARRRFAPITMPRNK